MNEFRNLHPTHVCFQQTGESTTFISASRRYPRARLVTPYSKSFVSVAGSASANVAVNPKRAPSAFIPTHGLRLRFAILTRTVGLSEPVPNPGSIFIFFGNSQCVPVK